MDKKIKLLLLLLNKNGKNINLDIKMKYSKEYDNIYSIYTLEFWNKAKRINKETGLEEEYYYCKTQEFKNKTNLIKYLVAIKDGLYE